MELLIFTANQTGNKKNCYYPNRVVAKNAAELQKAVMMDHVCAEYRNDYRSNANFMQSVVVVMDCDNDHSELPGDWMTPDKLKALLPTVAFAIAPSRNNMKEKDGKPARPRFHVYFFIHAITDSSKYAALKRAIWKRFPFFDGNALDAGRFIYGADAGECIWHDGGTLIDDIVTVEESEHGSYDSGVIPAGMRNSTLSRFAGRVVVRYGATDKAYQIFREEAMKCDPPLDEEELGVIWNSATKFAKKVQEQEDYVSPEEYEDDFAPDSLKPSDYSDIGQAKVLTREYGNELRFSTATDYLRFNGEYWVESKQQAVGAMEEFLDLQLQDALDAEECAMKGMVSLGFEEDAVRKGGKKFEELLTEDEEKAAYAIYQAAVAYVKFVMKRRDMKYVVSALQAAKPMLEVQPSDLDRNEFLLNTPNATYYLPDGLSGMKAHDAADLITKHTLVSPGDEGKQLWEEALDLFFCGDKELIDYVQKIVGLSAIGKVYVESMIIAYGDGRNGKSTFWNSISRVLGTYSGSMSADALTVGCKRNVKPEMAELKGKRLIIAAELEEGMCLNTSVIKQLCSTDEISAEKKYKDPFHFIPSHTLVLYTNHLPRVGANDDDTWRRLVVIPFNARIEGKSDVKNYTDYLVKNAGPSIMAWIIEGAQKAIQQKYKFEVPACVDAAIKAYRENNDWLGAFLDECCELDSSYTQKSGDFYSAYRAYCTRCGEYARSTTDFYSAIDAIGLTRKKTKKGVFIKGVRLKEEEDFLD